MNSKKSTIVRLSVALVCIVLTQLTVAHLKSSDKAKADHMVELDVKTLPLSFEGWVGAEAEANEKLNKALGALSMVDRSYSDVTGQGASLHLSTFTVESLSLPHPPQLCYPGAGWQIVSDEWKNESTDRPYRMMVVEQRGERAALAYWYQLGPYITSNRSDLRVAFQKIRRSDKRWPPLVKVLIQTSIRESDDEAKAVVEGLGANIYEWIKANSEG